MSDTAPSEATAQATSGMLRLSDPSSLDRVVTVAMPRSLPDLQHTAAQHFGHGGCLRLYHKGLHLLYHPTQLQQLNHMDVIIVRRSESHRPISPRGTPRAMTEHQANFLRHPFEAPPAPLGTDDESILTETTRGKPFEGMSRYARDFVQHPRSVRESFKQPAAFEVHNEPLATTSYAREFPWRENVPKTKPCGNDLYSSDPLSAHGAPLAGKTSYSIDYPKKPHPSPREPMYPPHSLTPPSLPLAAATTYSGDFKKLGVGRQPSARPKAAERSLEPFLGSSEYRRQYHKVPHAAERNALVQLATEKFQGTFNQDAEMVPEAAPVAVDK